MRLDLRVREEAEEELRTAYLWYESKRAGLGDEFLSCLERLFDTIAHHPRRYRKVYQEVRQGLMRRFPYSVLYVVEEHGIEVFGIFHGSRDPREWMGRIR